LVDGLDDAGPLGRRIPTAKRTGAIAVMHAKILVADQKRGYLGTANISRAAFLRGFEVGMIVEGRLAKNLCHLNDWVFARHQPLQIDERELLPRARVQKRDSEAWLARAIHSAHREVQAPPP
jgi:phosphatidylserine/phosphatidylglycerophosphate/cardiolipin synthase-like enzyme